MQPPAAETNENAITPSVLAKVEHDAALTGEADRPHVVPDQFVKAQRPTDRRRIEPAIADILGQGEGSGDERQSKGC